MNENTPQKRCLSASCRQISNLKELQWKPSTSRRKLEYIAAQEMLRHYDSLNWQIGAILIASTVLLTGMVLNKEVIDLRARDSSVGGSFSAFPRCRFSSLQYGCCGFVAIETYITCELKLFSVWRWASVCFTTYTSSKRTSLPTQTEARRRNWTRHDLRWALVKMALRRSIH